MWIPQHSDRCCILEEITLSSANHDFAGNPKWGCDPRSLSKRRTTPLTEILKGLMLFLLFQVSLASSSIVVSQDGSGDYKTITEAVMSASNSSVIHVKRGFYMEYIQIPKEIFDLRMIGEGIDNTVISGNRSVHGDPHISTPSSATLSVYGPGFILQSITVQNTAGPTLMQAVTLLSQSDHSVYCRIEGFQDTVLVDEGYQFYKDCEISGTVDFIWGAGKAVFQNCSIITRDGLPGQSNTITASRRYSNTDSKGGFSFQHCTISTNATNPGDTYLGRPWNIYAVTVFMESYLSKTVSPEGWLKWNGNNTVDKLFYGEYNNEGPGANLVGRVKWPGYHIMNRLQAERFTVARFIDGDSWLPATRIPYQSGL